MCECVRARVGRTSLLIVVILVRVGERAVLVLLICNLPLP